MPIKVSVLMPICNVEKYLRECLESAVNQTLGDIEFICMNDGSKDSSGAILDEFAARYPNIKAVHKENEGYGISMNRALDMAQGEYIGILESDDFASPDMFESLYELAVRNDADAVKSNYYIYTSFPEPRDSKIFFMNNCHPYEVYSPRDKNEIFFYPPAIWSGLYRRAFLVENDIRFTETPGASYQDTAFNFKVWAAAERVVTTDRAFLHYRCDNEGSSVKSKTKTYYVNHELGEMQKYLDQRPKLKERLASLIPAIKFKTYLWNLDRLTPELRSEYYQSVVEEFEELKEQGLVDIDRFYELNKKDAEAFLADPHEFFEKRYGVEDVKHSIVLLLDASGASPKRFFDALKKQQEQSYEVVCLSMHPNPMQRERVLQESAVDARVRYVDARASFSGDFSWSQLRGKYAMVIPQRNLLAKDALVKVEKACGQGARVIDAGLGAQEIFAGVLENGAIPPVAAAVDKLEDVEFSRLQFECGLHLFAFEQAEHLSFTEQRSECERSFKRPYAPDASAYKKYFDEYRTTLGKGRTLYGRIGLEPEFNEVFSQLACWIPQAYYNLSDAAKNHLSDEYLPGRLQNTRVVSSGALGACELTIVVFDRGEQDSSAKCIESVMRQSVRSVNVIHVTRRSDYGEEHKPDAGIVVLESPHDATMGQMLNAALDLVNTPYVMFVDGGGEFTADDSVEQMLDAVRASNENVCAGHQKYEFVTTSEKLRDCGNILGTWAAGPMQCGFKEHQFDAGISRCVFKTEFLRENGIRFKGTSCYAERVFIVEALSAAGTFQGIPTCVFMIDDHEALPQPMQSAEQAKSLVKDLGILLKLSKENALDWIHVSAFDSFARHSKEIEPHLRNNELMVLLVQAQTCLDASLFKAQGRICTDSTMLQPLARVSEILSWKGIKEVRLKHETATVKAQVKALKKEKKALNAQLKELRASKTAAVSSSAKDKQGLVGKVKSILRGK